MLHHSAVGCPLYVIELSSSHIMSIKNKSHILPPPTTPPLYNPLPQLPFSSYPIALFMFSFMSCHDGCFFCCFVGGEEVSGCELQGFQITTIEGERELNPIHMMMKRTKPS